MKMHLTSVGRNPAVILLVLLVLLGRAVCLSSGSAIKRQVFSQGPDEAEFKKAHQFAHQQMQKLGRSQNGSIPQPLPKMLQKQVNPHAAGARLPASTTMADEILVKARKGSSLEAALKGKSVSSTYAAPDPTALGVLGEILTEHKAEPIRPAFRASEKLSAAVSKQAGATGLDASLMQNRADLFRWHRVKLGSSAEAAGALAKIRALKEIEAAELNGCYRTADLPEASTDPGYARQWHLQRLRIPETWQFLVTNNINPGGKRDVIVAVIDTGVDYNHEELQANMWVNGREVPGNSIDDDNNGYVDDIHGCSTTYDPREHSGNPMDVQGHGTHIAGAIAATAYNQSGGVGVAFNVQIMAIRIAQETGVMTFEDAAEGILYAVDNGADVINMSWGGYYPSQIVEDALAVAFNQAVLVASAGNDGVGADAWPFYPAAYTWVLGVMASDSLDKLADFSNYDNSGLRYQVAAPGVQIYSSLPNNGYAAWSGTSMAAPVVAGVAALLRSYYSDRNLYSSRFIMGQIVGAVPKRETRCPILNPPGAMMTLAKPDITFSDAILFDEKDISPSNDEDGSLDAGETVQLGVELRNLGGYASQVRGFLTTTDPYTAVQTAEASFNNMGPMATGNNGFAYVNGVLSGVARPFAFRIASNCPNGHVIGFDLSVHCKNGADLNDTNSYVSGPLPIAYVVVRGRQAPRILTEDFEFTSSDYWVIQGPMMVEASATLRIGPGTFVQWGGLSDDPYNPGPQPGNIVVRGKLMIEGTLDNPVNLFPSYLVAGQTTRITVSGPGVCEMRYAKVRNPELVEAATTAMRGLRLIDHCYLDWEAYPASIQAVAISHSILHRLPGGSAFRASRMNTCLFDGGGIAAPVTPDFLPSPILNSTFLQELGSAQARTLGVPPAFIESEVGRLQTLFLSNAVLRAGFTYAGLPMSSSHFFLAETIANFFAGHVACPTNQAEMSFVDNYAAGLPKPGFDPSYVYIGLSDQLTPGLFEWVDGSAVAYTNWAQGWPENSRAGYCNVVSTDGRWKDRPAQPPDASGGVLSWFVLKLPGAWNNEALRAPVLDGSLTDYVRDHYPGSVRFNAFLNKYWDTRRSDWMRIEAFKWSPEAICLARDNFWGTTNSFLVDLVVNDYTDDFTSGKVDYGALPEHGFPSTYPFAEKVLINGMNAETIPVIGAGDATFQVAFNRAMDTNITPFVTFGPAVPYTDFAVKPDTNGWNGWSDSRTWVGGFKITPMIGEGFHLMRVSGAVAADDPWLVTGNDVERFRFQVKTLGTASLNLQASGGEGRIELAWQQTDFELLSGYNLYRADAQAGPFKQVNTTVIPVGSETYTDTNVAPAQTKHYRFTVVRTDLQESDASNIASAASLDTIPPVLTHTPATSALPARGLRLTATATDNLQVAGVIVFYRPSGSGSNYASLAMVNVAGSSWSATIPGSAVQSPGVDYYLTATDGISEVFSGTPTLPHVVLVSNVPTLGSVTPNHGPAEGGTAVTLAGTLFEPGVQVLFGGVLASNVTLMSPNQLTCVTPPHFPALVDVMVANTNGTESTLLNAFLFEQTGVVVAMPQTNGDYGTQVELGLSAADVAGLRAVDATITFDPTVLSAVSARVGMLTAGWTLSANLSTPGRAVLSLANASSTTGSGSLVLLRFNLIKPPPASTPLAIESLFLNDGAITTVRSDGLFTVNGFFTLSGTVHYFNGGQVVPGTLLTLVGAGEFAATSHTNGTFSITNIPTGSYTATPSKTNDASEITGYDASLVLQAAAGPLSLSPNQILAADVNCNGSVSAMDASYILEKAVGLIPGSFPGAGRMWSFAPSQRSYSLLNSNQSSQDFTAVLIGDVSGNWIPIASQGSPPPAPVVGQGASGSPKDKGGSPKSVVLGMDNGPWPHLPGEQVARILMKTDEASVYGIDLTLSYVPSNHTVAAVRPGNLAQGVALAINTNLAGVVGASLASASPLSGSGALLLLSFAGDIPVDCQVDQVRINEGQVSALVESTTVAFDSDSDGLIDVDEVEIYLTDPLRPDTDIDGMTDGAEVRAGTNPLSKDDVFAVVKAEATDGMASVAWTAKSARTYQVVRSFDLLIWAAAPSSAGSDQQSRQTAVSNGLLRYVDWATHTNTAGKAFYRVQLVE